MVLLSGMCDIVHFIINPLVLLVTQKVILFVYHVIFKIIWILENYFFFIMATTGTGFMIKKIVKKGKA